MNCKLCQIMLPLFYVITVRLGLRGLRDTGFPTNQRVSLDMYAPLIFGSDNLTHETPISRKVTP